MGEEHPQTKTKDISGSTIPSAETNTSENYTHGVPEVHLLFSWSYFPLRQALSGSPSSPPLKSGQIRAVERED